MKKNVKPGIDTFLNEPDRDKNLRFGLVTNDAAFTSDGTPTRLALIQNKFNLLKIFSPEHGLTVTGADGVFQNNCIDSLTGLPVISLYGDHLIPSEEDLSDIDIILFDIPDVGCRFYTYLWTMTYVMEACAAFNKPLIILDRPNPISGDLSLAEGPMLDEINCSSFIGRWSMPIRHCCTLGELAQYFAAIKISNLQLKIIPVQNWQRHQTADAWGYEFIPTSPAIRNITTAMLYPGMGLLEGININEGRGTERPFQVCGAPWINEHELQELFISKNLPGIISKPVKYTPDDSLYKGIVCHGLEISISDEKLFRPVKTVLVLLRSLFALYPEQVKERLYCTHANSSGKGHLDKLLGVKNAFENIKTGNMPATDVSISWPPEISSFLIYS
jgi:uncharacterized protein YbbC (DUF1343 family)